MTRVAIIGAGPAGIRAAETLVAHRLRPMLVTEAPTGGGQIYRRQPAGFGRSSKALYGSEAHKADALHQTFDKLRTMVDFRNDTAVWNIIGKTIYLESGGRVTTEEVDHIVLATGAMDRVLPMPGWTLPGVYTMGGAQIALKHQGCAIGDAVAFVGTGPLLYLVAYQYRKTGAKVVGVFDTSPFGGKIAAMPGMLASPRATWYGMSYMARLIAGGVPVHQGIVPQAVLGTDRVEGLRWSARGKTHEIACSAVGLGYGIKPENQLADLAGCSFTFDPSEHLWITAHDGEGRACDGVYVAGDCAAIGGADVAERSGELAALSLLHDIDIKTDPARRTAIKGELARLARFRAGLNRAFPFPANLAADLPDETILCRCETIRAGDVRGTIDALAPAEINRLKAFSRTGMGRCQGRVCGPVIAEVLAQTARLPIDQAGRFRGQAPVKPLSFSATATAAEPGHVYTLAKKGEGA